MQITLTFHCSKILSLDLYLLYSWIDQYLLGGGTDFDTDDLVSVAEMAVEVIVGELLPNVLVSVVGPLPNGFVYLSSVIPVNGIEIKSYIGTKIIP